ncbi:hypothetical protein ACLKA6_014042 [Drosophila palustris]
MMGIGLVNAIVFGVYGNVQRLSDNPNSLMSHFWAGATGAHINSKAPSIACYIYIERRVFEAVIEDLQQQFCEIFQVSLVTLFPTNF